MAFKISKEIRIGFLVVIALGLLVWGYYFLKGKDLFGSENVFYAVYDKVDGLQESSPITINGLKVGVVRDIDFLSDRSGRIIVALAIEKSQGIPDSTIAELYSADIMGNRAIRLVVVKTDKFTKPGDTLISLVEKDLKEQVSAQVLPLKIKAEDLISTIDSVMTVIKTIFDENTRANLAKSFASIKSTIQNLEHTSVTLDTLMQNESSKLQRIFSNIESITLNLRNNNEQLSTIINNFSAISDSIAKADIKSTILNANKALSDANYILEKIKRGEGSMGLLINNDSLYNNLEKASHDLDLLMKDIRENPKRYLHFSVFDFGKTVIVDEDGNKVRRRNQQSDTILSLNTIYKIQIRSSKKPIPASSKELKGIENYSVHYINGWYKYTIGSFSTYDEALHYQSTVSEKFPDAFVIKIQESPSAKESKATGKNI